MKRVSAFAPVAFALAASGCATPDPAGTAYLRAFADARTANRPFTPVSATQPALDLAGAYRLQRRMVAGRVAAGDRAAGYKGGLMSAASMRGRQVTEPLVGVLFSSGRIAQGGAVSLCGYRKASFEVKLGYVFDRAVRSLPRDEAALRDSVGRVVPVIDLPDIGYRDPDRYSAIDMVAANITAASYVMGTPQRPGPADLDALRVSIERDGSALTAGRGDESLGNQWHSLFVLVRQIFRSGRSVSAGDLLITGKIGDRGWLPPGHYLASYGQLGDVTFTVVPCAR